MLSIALSVGSGCFSGEEGEMFYGRVVVPRSQEFRWSDGGLPRVFDPARASAPPDTDAVRALFEGLTDYDPKTLKPVAGVASRWESSDDHRVWTFHLRPEARWSNGDPVTAEDFVRSWRRTLRLGEDAPHAKLLADIVELKQPEKEEGESPARPPGGEGVIEQRPDDEGREQQARGRAEKETSGELAVEAVDRHILRVRLRRPDKNFPELVAHPVFRPVHASAAKADTEDGREELGGSVITSPEQIISNGAFRLRELHADAVVLERERNYWDAAAVALERVRFVGARDAESALTAYRAGQVDAVTNARVEPLGLKLLASYKDFRRTAFGALTYYDINTTRPPFDDARVREALARAIDRRRMVEDTLEGAAEPADSFLPQIGAEDVEEKRSPLAHNPAAARKLLAEAGYPGGAGFPRVRLLVNRNDQHRRVAEAMASMWRATLGVETEILLKDWDEYETLLRSGEYDVARRSLVMQTTDEETVMRALFDPERFDFDARSDVAAEPTASPSSSPSTETTESAEAQSSAPDTVINPSPILTETLALRDVPAVPVYFATSYALVKPYVQGFDANILDAPSLRRVRIDTNWQPPKSETRITLSGD